jgi:CubicO group peptidase (beta-lactamase class C family)
MRIICCALLLICFSTIRAQNRFAPVDRWLKDNSAGLAGRAVLLIYKDGKIIYRKSFNDEGWRRRAANFSEDTQRPIASCSKWLSAALVMSFMDEGKLKVEDSVGKFLPVMTANGKGHITIGQCLSHLTGIKQVGLGDDEDGRRILSGGDKKYASMNEAIEAIAKMPMEGEPGKIFHYGNAGLQIAAAVIEKISGKKFETLFQERIARTCGMTNTTFGNNNVVLAAGGARGTAMDYLHFLEMILHRGEYNGRRVLSESSIALMQVNYAKDARVVYSPAAAAGWGYGFGEWVMKESVLSSPGLFGSFPWVDYGKGYCGMLFTVNLNNRNRAELYKGLMGVVEKCL